MSVYKRGEPKPLETFQYEHITFFGASSLCTYKIIVDEREMFFETPLVRAHHIKYYYNIFTFSSPCLIGICVRNMEEPHATSYEGTDHIFFAFHIKMFSAGFVAVQSN